jgi:hypothetical protein
LRDSPKVNKKKKEIPTEESIPTIIELIDLPEVIEALAKEIQRQWPEADDDEHAHEQAQRARVELRKPSRMSARRRDSSRAQGTFATNISHTHCLEQNTKRKRSVSLA